MKWLFIIILFPLNVLSQDITGVWKGTIFNDTTKQFIPYEIAVSEYNGKLSGYSHTTFNNEGKEMVGIKSIKIKKKNDKYFIEDVDLIYNNYTVDPPAGVRQYSLLSFKEEDSLLFLDGIFNTNRTREYKPLTGKVHLQKKKDNYQSALITKLKELNLASDLSFLQSKEKKNEPVIMVKEETKPVTVLPSSKNKKEIPQEIIQPKIIAKETFVKNPAAEISKRLIENIQSVNLHSDSITITLYDNGEVDGDTVSVLMNGKIILPMQGLSTNAITKTIYITPDLGDSIQLIMYAENLGRIPPNTGLLILQDGNNRYEIRFAGDLQKNSAIILRRKSIVKEKSLSH